MSTIRLFYSSLLIIIIVVVISTFWQYLGFKKEFTIYLAISLTIAFVLNIIGLIYGIRIGLINKRKSRIGILGNGILIILYISMVIYSVY